MLKCKQCGNTVEFCCSATVGIVAEVDADGVFVELRSDPYGDPVLLEDYWCSACGETVSMEEEKD